MNPVFMFILGLLIEWIIDCFYWRKALGMQVAGKPPVRQEIFLSLPVTSCDPL